MLTTVNQIDPAMSVNELVHRYPASLPVLKMLGIDSCCGGAKTLSAAAETAVITLDALLSSVTTSTSEASPKDGCCNCGGNCSGDG